MTAVEIQKVVVFRRPSDDENYSYWMTEVSEGAARELEERLHTPQSTALEGDLKLSDAMTLPQIMEKLNTRDFQVIDFPTGH